MAIAFGSKSAFVSGATDGDITLDKPSGTAEGDLLLAHISTDNTETITPPAGWTKIGSETSGSTDINFWKVAGSSEPSTYGFDISSWERYAACMSRFTGDFGSNPIDVNASDTGTGADPTSPSITPTQTPTMLISTFSKDENQVADGSENTGQPSGYTNIYSDVSGGTGACCGGAAYKAYTGTSATGTQAWDISNGSYAWGAHHFAIYEEVTVQTVTPTVIGLTAAAQTPSLSLGSVSATPTVQSLTASAQAPTLEHNRTVTPTVAGLTATPQTPDLALGQTVSPTVIGISITPQTPSAFNNLQIVTPTVVSLTNTVQVPTVASGLTVVTPDSISLTLTTNVFTIGLVSIIAYSQVQSRWVRKVYRFDHYRTIENKMYPVYIAQAPSAQVVTPDVISLSLSTIAPTLLAEPGPQPGDLDYIVIPPQDLDIIIQELDSEFIIRR